MLDESRIRLCFQDFKLFILVFKKNLQQALHKKCPYLELFWSVFSRIGLNTERYGVSFRIQSECGKIQTRITPNTDTFHADEKSLEKSSKKCEWEVGGGNRTEI